MYQIERQYKTMDKKLTPLVGQELLRIRTSKPNKGRKKPGWSRQYVADLAGLHPNTLEHIEMDATNTTLETIESICVALETTFEDVLCGLRDRQDTIALLEGFKKSGWMKLEDISEKDIEELQYLPLKKILGKNVKDKAIALLIQARKKNA